MTITKNLIRRFVYTLILIVFSSTLTSKYIELKNVDVNDDLSTEESNIMDNEVSEMGIIKDLKQKYFDDLEPLWGNGDGNGGFIPKAFSSEYAPRSLPKLINYPNMVDDKEVEIIFINRNEIKPIFGIPEGPDKGKFSVEEINAIDSNYLKYGTLLGGFFSNIGEIIYSIENSDVDKDGLDEELIVTGQIGGNHPPNNGYIVKNKTIVAAVSFASGKIYPSKDGDGFYIEEPDYTDSAMCCPKRSTIIRVIYENGKYIPVWEQKVEYLSF